MSILLESASKYESFDTKHDLFLTKKFGVLLSTLKNFGRPALHNSALKKKIIFLQTLFLTHPSTYHLRKLNQKIWSILLCMQCIRAHLKLLIFLELIKIYMIYRYVLVFKNWKRIAKSLHLTVGCLVSRWRLNSSQQHLASHCFLLMSTLQNPSHFWKCCNPHWCSLNTYLHYAAHLSHIFIYVSPLTLIPLMVMINDSHCSNCFPLSLFQIL